MLLFKLILIVLLGFIVVSLFSGLYFLVKDKGETKRTVNALSIRIGLSIVAILFVIGAAATGVIEFRPNPLNTGPADGAAAGSSPDAGGSDRSADSPAGGGRRPIE